MALDGQFSANFQRMIDRPEELLRALEADPDAFEHAVMVEESGHQRVIAAIPNRNFLGFLLYDAQGQAIPTNEPGWLPHFASFDELMADAEVRSGDGRLIGLPGPTGRLNFALWAPFGETNGWNLPARLREIAAEHAADKIVLVANGTTEPIERASESFGLSNLQCRVVAAVVRTGSVREAAQSANISYATARETMAAVARRMLLPNTPAVVRTVVSAAFGVMPGQLDGPALLADMLRITPRQAQISLLVADGLSREQVAKAIGASQSVVKKELELLFANFGVQSAAELARLIVEAQALRSFARSIDGAPGFLDASIEPTRLALRPQTTETIGWSDYGPASGKPVLVVHSNWSCRAVPRPLLIELQSLGWRPIAIDRPGFGATQLGSMTRERPFDQAIADTLQILDSCRIREIAVIAKCGAQFVHALKIAAPERVGPVVLVSPTPQASHKGRRIGLVGMVKETYLRRPRLIEVFFRMICTQFTLTRVEQLTRAIVKGSKTDEALCNDPQFIRDRFRALRPMSTGNVMGGIIEEHVISQGTWDFVPLDVADWSILQGEDDIHNSVEEVADYWRKILPRTPLLKVPDGGRFMTSSHPALIADTLGMIDRAAV